MAKVAAGVIRALDGHEVTRDVGQAAVEPESVRHVAHAGGMVFVVIGPVRHQTSHAVFVGDATQDEIAGRQKGCN